MASKGKWHCLFFHQFEVKDDGFALTSRTLYLHWCCKHSKWRLLTDCTSSLAWAPFIFWKCFSILIWGNKHAHWFWFMLRRGLNWLAKRHTLYQSTWCAELWRVFCIECMTMGCSALKNIMYGKPSVIYLQAEVWQSHKYVLKQTQNEAQAALWNHTMTAKIRRQFPS